MSLRQRVLRGGAYLTMRQGMGTVLNVAGVLLLMRALDPAEYGVYAAAIGVFMALQLAAQLGINIYLVRRPQEPDESVYDQAFSLLLVLGVIVMALASLAAPLIERWTGIAGITPVVLVAFAALPLTNIALVPMARLERSIDYRSIAWIELLAQLLFFGVGIPLALAGLGAWAPLIGWWVQQSTNCVLYHRAARYRPGWHFERAEAVAMLRYGGGYATSLWIWQLRRLANPLIVGRYLGAEAVGFVALTVQIVTHLNFVATATYRLATTALARVQHDLPRMTAAITEGMPLQVMASAPFLVGFHLVAPWAVPALLGAEWAGVMVVYPFIATMWLAHALTNLHSSALYVLGRHLHVAAYHLAHTLLLMVAAFALVPRYGLVGYGMAELITLAGYVVLHAAVARTVGTPRYERALPLWLAAVLLLFHAQLGWPGLLAALVAALWSRPWHAVRDVLAGLRTAHAYQP